MSGTHPTARPKSQRAEKVPRTAPTLGRARRRSHCHRRHRPLDRLHHEQDRQQSDPAPPQAQTHGTRLPSSPCRQTPPYRPAHLRSLAARMERAMPHPNHPVTDRIVRGLRSCLRPWTPIGPVVCQIRRTRRVATACHPQRLRPVSALGRRRTTSPYTVTSASLTAPYQSSAEPPKGVTYRRLDGGREVSLRS